MTALEERLREALQAQAARVEPDPRTWTTVERRIRRGRLVRLSFALAGAAAAVVVAVVAVPTLFAEQVRFAPPVADRPDGSTADDAPTAAAPLAGCTERDDLVAAAAGAGGVQSLCLGGGAGALAAGAPAANPAIAPDGRSLVYERHEGPYPLLVWIDLSELPPGEEHVIGGGRLPTFAPDGRLARVMGDEGQVPEIEVVRPFDEPTLSVPAGGVDVAAMAWDPVGDHLLYESVTAAAERSLWLLRPDGGEPLPEPLGTTAGTVLRAPAFAPDGTLAALEVADDGSVALVHVDRRVLDGGSPEPRALVDLTAALDLRHPAFDEDGDLVLRSAGYLAAAVDGDTIHLEPGAHPAWFVGDGRRVWLVAETASGAEATLLPLEAGAVVGNPAARAPERVEPSLDAVPEPTLHRGPGPA